MTLPMTLGTARRLSRRERDRTPKEFCPMDLREVHGMPEPNAPPGERHDLKETRQADERESQSGHEIRENL